LKEEEEEGQRRGRGGVEIVEAKKGSPGYELCQLRSSDPELYTPAPTALYSSISLSL
jgi:hypothetical protein